MSCALLLLSLLTHTVHFKAIPKAIDALCILPSALQVKLNNYSQARVNGGSNYDSLGPPEGDRHSEKLKVPSVDCYNKDPLSWCLGQQRAAQGVTQLS